VFVPVSLNKIENDPEASLIAILSDATELKTLEAQFVQSQKMQAIGQLAGGVAHDLNNLLTAISGHCDLLLLRHDTASQDYADLVQINQNANRAAALVSQLLAFSRKQTLRPEPIDMRNTLADLMHLLNRLVGEKVELVLEHDTDLKPVRADKRQLEQVFMNLVVNARDAMPEGGRIHIKTEGYSLEQALDRDRATIPAGDYISVTVTDEGCGIATDKLTKIIEPFYSTKRTGEGTGLGLSTVYGIVKQTGGYIFVQSDEGQGTEFNLILPIFDGHRTEIAPVDICITCSAVARIQSDRGGLCRRGVRSIKRPKPAN
jgi:two-component system cell cycle sensor histidine kinase/response regulator CckA